MKQVQIDKKIMCGWLTMSGLSATMFGYGQISNNVYGWFPIIWSFGSTISLGLLLWSTYHLSIYLSLFERSS